MSVIGILREPKKSLALGMCWLLAMPMLAQQGGDAKPQQPAQNASAQTGAPGTSVPEIKPLPSPTSVDYSKPATFFPNPLKLYTPRLVPLPSFTNSPRIQDLLHDGYEIDRSHVVLASPTESERSSSIGSAKGFRVSRTGRKPSCS